MTSAPTFSSFPELPSTSKVVREEEPERRSKEARKRRDEDDERRPRDRGEHRSKRRHDDEEENRRRREDKERRRREERRRAEALVKSERPSSEKHAGESSARPAHRDTDRREHAEDGVPWYESSKKGKGRAEFEYDETSGSTFFPDPVGDRDALRYGSSSSLQPPRYYREGQGRVLGCNEGLRIVLSRQRTEKGLELAPRGRPYIPRYSARTLEGSSRNSRRLLLQPNHHNPFDANTPFISFGAKAGQRPDEDDTPDYRAISREEEEVDHDTAAIEETLGGFSTLDQDIQRRTAELDRHLRENPDDVKAWIAYSRLHLKLNPDTQSQRGTDPAALPQTKASAEVTLSVLAKALNHPPSFTSIPLHLAYIRAAEAFWPPDKVTKRWQNVLRELGERAQTDKELESRLMEIWTGYIGWREGQGFGKQEDGQKGAGGVDEVLEVYTECLSRLTSMATDGDTSIREENQLYLFTRACLFMRQAGYAERAFACFQALMEITLFKPDHLRPPSRPPLVWFAGLLGEFEVFWESESPRVGEADATGWRNATSSTAPPTSPATSLEHRSDDPFERWREAESHAESQNSLPARATDLDADDEDPYRVVIFSDIQPFLFPIRSGQVRLELVYAFLNFIGLPFRPPDTPTTSPAYLDPHLNWSLVYNDQARSAFWPARPKQKQLPWQTVGGEPMEPETQRSLANPFTSPVKSWLSTPDTLFAASDRWFRDATATELTHVDQTLARNVFKLLQPLVPDPTFTAMYMAFEAAISPKASVKLAKSILSTDRDNAAIWDGYARLEAQRGNIASARGVYATVLQSDKVPADERLGLYAAWARMEWDAGEEGRSLAVVVAASTQGSAPGDPSQPPTTIGLLKAKQHYATVEYPCAFPMLVLASFYAYLTAGIESAQGILIRQLKTLRPSSTDAEEVFQLLNRMLYVHTSRHPSPAALSRDTLELAFASFPNNTQFLSLYMWGELGGRVYGRLQRLISDQLNSDSGGVNGQLWSIWAEAMSAHRTFWDAGGGGAERVRNALDKSISSKIGKHSAPTWMLYIEFETHMGRYSSAKQLCYRAVAALGGCKPIYLMPFSPALRPHFSPQELRDWADLMIERGLRLRVPFEEYFDVNETEAAIVLPEDEELQDDELAFLRDTEEAKPY